ncbi:MAG TPA: PLP-dependent aminotransferase family protein [Streptosporangiales bacterium]
MAESGTNSGLASELPLVLRRGDGVALHTQIERSIRTGIRSGRLPRGTVLPPTRTLAADLGVSRGVVVEAYEQLVAEGYLTSRSGGYTEVAIDAEDRPAAPPRRPAPRLGIDFGYGRADVAHFPRTAWSRSVRRVLVEAPNERFGYLDGRGAPELCAALAGYLNRVRDTSIRAENVVVCNGYAQGISLVVGVLAAAGARRIAVEDPSADDDARPAAAACGLEVVGVPVGPVGVDVAALERSGADAVVLTPSHQWPTGAVLSADARLAVARWAERTGAVVVEDDYDAEYRYDRTPLGAMQGIAPDHVVYAGTTSKTVAPGLRLGWLVVPPRLVDAVAAAKEAADRGSPVLDQLAFADFLDRGELDRQRRRMRPVYRRRRDTLLAALRERLPELEPAGAAAGMHLVTWLPPGLDESAVVAAAAGRDVGVYGVGPYRLAPGRDGLIFGYSALGEQAIAEGVRRLAGAIGDLRAQRGAGGTGKGRPRRPSVAPS